MAIKVSGMVIKNYLPAGFKGEVEFLESEMVFYGPKWEIGLFFGLIPIRGKTKELFRMEYNDIEEITSKTTFKTEQFFIKLKGYENRKGGNGTAQLTFTPAAVGREMLLKYAGDRFVQA